MNNKTVMVSGCYDLVHGGHIAFFKDAAQFGKLIVCIGSDENINRLKFHDSLFTQEVHSPKVPVLFFWNL